MNIEVSPDLILFELSSKYIYEWDKGITYLVLEIEIKERFVL